jgi:EAL domain-containing protein (putative c-di-GMP-specific phosphodiesterase class I)
MFKHIQENRRVNHVISKNMFHHVFQPLYELENWCLFGYEALIRCKLPMNPEMLFRDAIQSKRIYELDTASIFNASLTYRSSGQSKQVKNLFLNVYPSTLLHPSFYNFVEKMNAHTETSRINVVFEIIESEHISNIKALRDTITFLRSYNLRIALDDVGKGSSTLEMILELEPDFIKLDRLFSLDLSISTSKQKMISLFVEYCKKNTKLILEGIETPEDLAIAKFLGVNIGQGYVLGTPKLL